MRFPSVGSRLLTSLAGLVIASCMMSHASCATYEDTLVRAERAFEQSEHERALAILRTLEPDMERLGVVGRAHYAYLRGMTDYRIGYRSEARHWLGIASIMAQETPGSLSPEWEKRLADSLKDLNEQVYTAGIASLSGQQPAQSEETESEEPDAAGGAAAPTQ